MNILSMIKNKNVTFVEYRKDNLWYVTECGFEFPVPVEDTGDGIFKSTEKAIMLMRYIRKHIEVIEKEMTNVELV